MIDRPKRLARWAQGTVPGRLARKFGEDNGANQAVLIAWNMLGTIFPIALFLAAVLGVALNVFGLHEEAVYRNVFAMIPDDHSRQDFVSAVKGVKQSSGLLFLVGLAAMLWSASSLFGAMEQAFDLLFHALPRPFLKQKLMAVAMMGLFTVLAGVAVASSTLLGLLKSIPDVPAPLSRGLLAYFLQPVVGVAAGFLLFGTMYYVVPNRRQRFSEVWPGALLAGIGFEALSLAFPLYLSLNKGINQYGKAFALLFILLAYFYFLGLITILGAELNSLLHPVPVSRPDRALALSPAAAPERPEPRDVPRRARRVPSLPAGSESSQPARSRMPALKRALFGALGGAIGLFAFARHRRRVA